MTVPKSTSARKNPPGATARGRAAAEKAAAAKAAAAADVPVEPPAADVKAEATEHVVTVNIAGHDWKIELARLDDFELIEDLGLMDAGEMGRLPSALRRVLGEQQYVAVKKLLRDPATGRVSIDKGAVFFEDLWKALAPNS